MMINNNKEYCVKHDYYYCIVYDKQIERKETVEYADGLKLD